MSTYVKYSKDCKIGIRALHNIHIALHVFGQMSGLASSGEPLTISSLFHMGVIRYAKPFLNSKFNDGTAQYPIKALKKISGFSKEIHDHLIHIRHTLIAHDDFDEIEPRVLLMFRGFEGLSDAIPMAAVTSNKTILYPVDTSVAQKFIDHMVIVANGIQNKLNEDLRLLRQIALLHPEQALEGKKYEKRYALEIKPDGSETLPPGYMNDDWLNGAEPDFSTIHNGYRYDVMKMSREFIEPLKIKLSNGEFFEVKPLAK